MKSIIPADNNWLGHWRWGPYMLLPITALVALLLILTIAQIGYGLNNGPGPDDTSHTYINMKFDGGGDLGLMLYGPIVETIHLPIHILLYLQAFPGWRLHPIAPLTVSIIMSALWACYAVFNLLNDFLSCECFLTATWSGLAGVRVAIAMIMSILYIVYLGFAAKAVHEWRQNAHRRWRGRASGDEAQIMEDVIIPAGKR